MTPCVVNDLSGLVVASVREQGLIDLTAAALAAGVSRSRIRNLIQQGRFRKYVVFGKLAISVSEFNAWASGRRSVGRRSGVMAGDYSGQM